MLSFVLNAVPAWLLGMILVGSMVGLSMAVHMAVRRAVPLPVLEANNEVAGFTYFFGVRNPRAQVLMTAMPTATIGFILFLVIAMDLPFTGDISIRPGALEHVRNTFSVPGS